VPSIIIRIVVKLSLVGALPSEGPRIMDGLMVTSLHRSCPAASRHASFSASVLE